MRIQEITDEVAEKLKISAETAKEPEPPLPAEKDEKPTSSEQQDGTKAPVFGPGLSPGRAYTSNKSFEEVMADLNKSPLFMTELEENDDIEALKALAYEGTPLEVALEFKERGNEEFKLRQWTDAREYYTKGVQVIVAEERKRADAMGKKQAVISAVSAEENTSPADIDSQRAVLEALYVNRAACDLELRNYRSCWTDCGLALRLNPRNVKALYRSARALLAVDRIEEADDACSRGLALDGSNAALATLARDIAKRSGEVGAAKRLEDERAARAKRRALLLKAAVKARGIATRSSTARPPDMEDAKLQLVPDPDDPRSSLSFPCVLLYPDALESDFIKAFNEADTPADHLGYVLPLPWDAAREYTLPGVECYMDTASGGVVKVGKKVSLLRILTSGNVEIVDDVVRIFVLPKAKAEDWVKKYKSQKAATKGG